ncbi:ATP-binding protein [Anaerobacillus alkalilacustris]|uniref:ATP-binding protein n=1 Tax=Anaerobacillus alkalilacustris TaxID=393763 RepID=UPI001472027A|nr:ATP-binding protein [Anaerobacillus alkalilacustris]
MKRIQTPLQEQRLRLSSSNLSEYHFFQIRKITISDQLEIGEIQSFVNRSIKEFIASLTDLTSPLIFRVKSNRENRTLTLLLGAKRKSGASIAERFSSYFQSVDFHEVNETNVDDDYNTQAIITGIPAYNDTKYVNYIEPFVRLIQNKDVLLEIVAKPVNKSTILRQLENVTELRTKNSLDLKQSYSESTATSDTSSTSLGQTYTDGSNSGGGLLVVNSSNSTSEGTTSSSSDTKGTTETLTKNMEKSDHQALEVDALLEVHATRLQQSLSSGLWKTSVSIYAKDRADVSSASEVYKSTYCQDAVEPYQVFLLKEMYPTVGLVEKGASGQTMDLFHEQFREFSFLTGDELSYAIDVPKEEYNGYEFSQVPRFSQNLTEKKGIPLGHLYDGEKKTTTLFHLDKNKLVKHVLVAGITGSGKTNTLFNLLRNVNVPFLIIEPAKKEYRALQNIIPNLRVYTMGNESVSPLRINPFYFPDHVNIQQHIDHLKVIFNASFTMYASMPNILEQCINNIYMKKGWSLTTSTNIYQSDHVNYEKYFPTIEDLYYEIDDYTKELGYAQEQMHNIRAALLTRIKSLMTGGKGFMLNTSETMDIKTILQYPTVLELDAVADDDEKSLIIGLISIFIYEYLKANETEFTGVLKHLLVLEEAHRIFANVNQHGSQEHVNIKGKAVESLSNILSEIRAYGEGMIIVDQVPTKLAPDVLKNTNTKIIHRIVSKDDAEYVANSLALPNEKIHFISKLTNGAALLYSDGMNAPAHVQISHGKGHLYFMSDQDLKQKSSLYNQLDAKRMHPLTEIIIQNMSLYSELTKEVERFYLSLLKEPLQHLHTNYKRTKEAISSHASIYGFDMRIDIDDFVFSFVNEALFKLVKANKKINKQINKRIFIEKYLEVCLDLLSKPYEHNRKEYTLLTINQKKLGGDYIV